MISRGGIIGQVIKRHLFTSYSNKMVDTNISGMRIDYDPGKQLDTENLPAINPISLFDIWFNEAKNCDKIEEANAMTLATCTRTGIPSARIVLLKGFGNRGFIFYTNYQSRKGQELEENPNAALVFHWQPLHKQIRIEGEVSKLSEEESTNYFHSRPLGSQIGACVSHQSLPIPNRQVLVEREEKLTEKFAKHEKIPKPEYWGGYLVTPRIIEFWQGQMNRLHDRIQFRRNELSENQSFEKSNCWKEGEDSWIYSRLSP
ncbi:pyridoxine-5'-phosphate oxidase-like [Dendronephthya gigantea]|uniref:pyridoxine-5'-phosphate oxidase-like n=1 Tax=Dendronephthya gigantea TaxID=151771 RepID=UPI001069D761|nr:pyridoxine-5'-phosphate oxidase-like [Dendronephthya gigantea]